MVTGEIRSDQILTESIAFTFTLFSLKKRALIAFSEREKKCLVVFFYHSPTPTLDLIISVVY